MSPAWSLLWLVMFQEFMNIWVSHQKNQQPLKMYCVHFLSGYIMHHPNWSTYYNLSTVGCTQDKKTCSNRAPDMMCFAAKHLKFAIKANCCARGNYCCLNMFLISVFHSTFRHISHSETAHLPPVLFLMSKNSCKEYFAVESENKSSRRRPSAPNFECLAATHHVCSQLEHVFSSRVHA